MAPAKPPVPATTPDSVPEWVYDHAHREDSSPLWSGRFLRNVVLVVFERGTTQPQRQAAVDRINGEVVGGVRAFGDDGYYFVRIADDGTAGPLLRATELLDSLPQVSHATAGFIFDDMEADRGGGAAPAATSLAGQRPPVPPLPPDSFPSRYYHGGNVIDRPACSKIPFLRHIVGVWFREGTPLEQRQAAVDSVGGIVVGGTPVSEDGLYILRVEDDATGAGVCRATRILEALPQVDLARPEYMARRR